MPRLYLHIGPPKTGTTYLQDVLYRNRDALAGEGVLYPADQRDAHYLAALDVRGLAFRGHANPAAEGAWAEVVRRTCGWTGDAVVVSHELFAGAPDPAIERIIEDLGADRLHVLVTARDLGRQVPAMWQESIKNGQTVPFGRYLRLLTRDPPGGRHAEVFWRQQDLAATLERWCGFVPATRIHVVTVPPAGEPPTQLWERVCKVIGVDPGVLDTEVRAANTSLTLPQAEFLRRVNAVLGNDLEWPDYEAVVKFGFAEEILSRTTDGPLARVPERMHEWFKDRAAQITEALIRAGYDIVGDLADLRPDFGAPEARSVIARPRSVANAGAEAVAAVLREQGTQHARRRTRRVRQTLLTSRSGRRLIRLLRPYLPRGTRGNR
ncbi:MAG: hypothetical protein ACRDP1_02365 [Nocardioidaceae bacterium]